MVAMYELQLSLARTLVTTFPDADRHAFTAAIRDELGGGETSRLAMLYNRIVAADGNVRTRRRMYVGALAG